MRVRTGTVRMNTTLGELKKDKSYPTKLWVDEGGNMVGWEITSTKPVTKRGGTPPDGGGRSHK